MSSSKSIFLIVSCLVLANGQAQADPQARVVSEAPAATHMGQTPKHHVYLVTGGGGSLTCPTGTLSAIRKPLDGQVPIPIEEFVVPEGSVLVLTDIAIGLREKPGDNWIEGNNIISAQLRIGAPGGPADETMWQTSIQIDGHMAMSENAWLKEQLTAGVVIGPGQRICVAAGFGISAVAGTVTVLNASSLYGYLVGM